jgi:group II intron reverse transcriptase/maturase
MIGNKNLYTYSRGKLQVFQEKLTLAAKGDRKRKFGNLYDKVCWMETIEEAWKRVRANKGASGVDGETIHHIETVIGVENFLKGIQTELVNKMYRPNKIKRVWIEKLGKKEKRPLGIPTVKDRVIQQAVRLIIEPILEVDFQEFSYGFRPNKSAHQALEEVRKYLAFGCQWVVDIDIKSCFDTIPHERLIELLMERIIDKWIIRLVRWWLAVGIMDGKEIHYQEAGTPQGGVLSPLLANLYLNVLDTYWQEHSYAKRYRRDSHLVRYADDIVVLSPREQIAEMNYKEIEELLGYLGLTLNQDKSRVVHLKKGFDFLGYHFTKGYSHKKRKEVVVWFPRNKAVQKIKGNIKELLSKSLLGGDIREMVEKLNSKVRGWTNYFIRGNSYRQISEVNRYTAEQLRLFLRRRYQKKVRGYESFPNSYLYERLGLLYLPGLFSNRIRLKVC